jgi:hypothetical protein
VADTLIAHVRNLRRSDVLADDFSFLDIRL